MGQFWKRLGTRNIVLSICFVLALLLCFTEYRAYSGGSAQGTLDTPASCEDTQADSPGQANDEGEQQTDDVADFERPRPWPGYWEELGTVKRIKEEFREIAYDIVHSIPGYWGWFSIGIREVEYGRLAIKVGVQEEFYEEACRRLPSEFKGVTVIVEAYGGVFWKAPGFPPEVEELILSTPGCCGVIFEQTEGESWSVIYVKPGYLQEAQQHLSPILDEGFRVRELQRFQ